MEWEVGPLLPLPKKRKWGGSVQWCLSPHKDYQSPLSLLSDPGLGGEPASLGQHTVISWTPVHRKVRQVTWPLVLIVTMMIHTSIWKVF